MLRPPSPHDSASSSFGAASTVFTPLTLPGPQGSHTHELQYSTKAVSPESSCNVLYPPTGAVELSASGQNSDCVGSSHACLHLTRSDL
ncbi:hypothetical protein RRG08_063364 [Elysia crispata]|uniref:Uncharacterized protein n=1 Tax=Elysia crispata TaxID=231223 RepID=A0AAE1B2F5_9GAST|nr:hypothetical protein RRG08_063364 [Elysia crispata]